MSNSDSKKPQREFPKKTLPELLDDYYLRLKKAQISHYSQSEVKKWWHTIISTLIIILTTIVSAFIFFEYTEGDSGLKMIMVGLSIGAAFLAALQPQLRLGAQAENHRTKAVQYGQLRREVEAFIADDKSTHEDKKKFLKRLQLKWDEVAVDAPVTPKAIRDRVK